LQVSAVVPETRAIVPPVPDIAVVPVASVVGSSTVPPVPFAWPTRNRPPAAIEPASGVVCHVLAALALAGRYCTLQPSTTTAAAPLFASSTKSWVSVAPELPPPPYTSAMSASGLGAAFAVTGSATASVTAVAAVTASPTRGSDGLKTSSGCWRVRESSPYRVNEGRLSY
jgi:hypothetical protein